MVDIFFYLKSRIELLLLYTIMAKKLLLFQGHNTCTTLITSPVCFDAYKDRDSYDQEEKEDDSHDGRCQITRASAMRPVLIFCKKKKERPMRFEAQLTKLFALWVKNNIDIYKQINNYHHF